MKRRKTKNITFLYYNSFDGSSLGSGNLPYSSYDAMNGKYSRWWKIWKVGLANMYGLEKRLVRCKIIIK